jgi:hypothetical protein
MRTHQQELSKQPALWIAGAGFTNVLYSIVACGRNGGSSEGTIINGASTGSGGTGGCDLNINDPYVNESD